jgi:CHAD domain-containing protein
MKLAEDFVCSLDQPWSEFSKAWKKTRRRASEEAIHDLRVNARRLIENLEVARALSKANDFSHLKRRFKKFLKGMGKLRDLQVQLENAAHLRRSQAIVDFTKRLERLERQEIENIQSELKNNKRQRFAHALDDVRSQFRRSQGTAREDRMRSAIRRILNTRHNEFIKAKRRFHRSEQHNEDALHEMRIALKKLRYAMEAAQPVLSESEKGQIDAMRAFQKLMGDSRDLEMLRSTLEQWAKKKGKKLAVIPALQNLEEKRKALLKKLVESSQELETILEPKGDGPVGEKHQVAEQTQVVRQLPAASTANKNPA